MESIDDLLSQLKAEYEEKNQPSQPQKQHSLKEEPSFTTSTPPAEVSWQSHQKITPSSAEYGLLAELKAEFEDQERAEAAQKQQQLKEEQRRQEQIKQQQRQTLKREAEAWLKKLNPRSAEGLWFEEFAYAYPSKLEAAIDYLQALKETQS